MGYGDVPQANVVAVNDLQKEERVEQEEEDFAFCALYLCEEKVHQKAAEEKLEQRQNDKLSLETVQYSNAGEGELT